MKLVILSGGQSLGLETGGGFESGLLFFVLASVNDVPPFQRGLLRV